MHGQGALPLVLLHQLRKELAFCRAWEKLNCIGDMFPPYLCGIHVVASVMLHGWSDVPAINAMWVPE
eukprot:10764661-Ditylum_brightwellii.AAC.1